MLTSVSEKESHWKVLGRFVIIYLHFHGTSLANLRTDRMWTRAGRLFKKNKKRDAEVLSQGGNSGDDRKWLALGWV